MKQIILNADVGEEIGFDAEIMQYISWCNIACGGHAGSEEVIQKTIDLAIENNVKIGAHPSYPDRENFGRKVISIGHDDLVQSITEQIRLVKFHVEQRGEKLHHVKPHGALYNQAIKNKEVAEAIIESIKNIDKRLHVITLKDSEISYLSKDVLSVKFEAFADRNYNEDLTLISRSETDALITDPKHVFDHVFKMVSQGKITTKEGEEHRIFFDTICVHGDNQNAVQILKFLHAEFSNRNFVI